MALISLGEWRARSAARVAAAERLKALLAAMLGLGEDEAVSVNEIACPDPGCPDTETVVLVMRRGRPTRAFRVRRPLDAVTPADLAGLVEEECVPNPAA